jgi:hypothetical protein
VGITVGKAVKAMRILCRMLPKEVEEFIAKFDLIKLNAAYELVKKQNMIREWLKSSGYCTFIGNGSILPRNKDNSGPLEGASPLTSREDVEVEITDNLVTMFFELIGQPFFGNFRCSNRTACEGLHLSIFALIGIVIISYIS